MGFEWGGRAPARHTGTRRRWDLRRRVTAPLWWILALPIEWALVTLLLVLTFK